MTTKTVALSDNVERELGFNNRAFFYFQKEYGESIFDLFSKMYDGTTSVGHVEITYLVWAGMLHKHPHLELEEAMDLISPDKILSIFEAISPLLEDAAPEQTQEQEEQTDAKKKSSTGSRSKSKSSGQKKQ